MAKKDEEKKRDPYDLRYIYEDMELELVASFRRNLIKHGIDEYSAGFSWEMWQLAQLRNIETYRKENKVIIGKYSQGAQDIIEDTLKHTFVKGQEKVEKQMEQADVQSSEMKVEEQQKQSDKQHEEVRKQEYEVEKQQEQAPGENDLGDGSFSFPEDGLNTGKVGKTPPSEKNFFGVNKKKLDAMINCTKNDFEDVNKAIYRKMDDVYRQTIFKTSIQLAHGTISLDKAIDNAVADFLKKGIDSIVYKNGRQVNIATYAEMVLRTTSQRAAFLGEGAKRDEYKNHLVLVSAHFNSCKLCLVWQGQILIDNVFSHPSESYLAKYKGKYKLLSQAIKAGLLHPNCRHTLATYFEGITRLPELPDKEIALKNYNAEQKQRSLENAIRKAKREYAGVVDAEKKKEAFKYLRAMQKRLRDHLKANPQLRRHEHREKIYGTEAKLGNGSNYASAKTSPGEYVEMIDMKDIDKYLEKYENEIKDYPVEHAFVIQKDGRVMHYVGNEKGVNFLSANLKGAIVTHNHPILDGQLGNSFADDDFRFLQLFGKDIIKLRATYGDYRYEVKLLKDLGNVSYSEYYMKAGDQMMYDDPYGDVHEYLYRLMAEEGLIEYGKTKV